MSTCSDTIAEVLSASNELRDSQSLKVLLHTALQLGNLANNQYAPSPASSSVVRGISVDRYVFAGAFCPPSITSLKCG
eukprot:m.187392 g.187392  ORF g.187392 m.187392 type:complete len:78 (+) comp25620_c0_seq4:290-523(+)